jgi:hypothetical protein
VGPTPRALEEVCLLVALLDQVGLSPKTCGWKLPLNYQLGSCGSPWSLELEVYLFGWVRWIWWLLKFGAGLGLET